MAVPSIRDTTEWEVWYVTGHRFTSRDCSWNALPDAGVLIVRAWFESGTMAINWDDGVYGHPDTWKQAGWVSDAEFARVLREATETVTRPSQRS